MKESDLKYGIETDIENRYTDIYKFNRFKRKFPSEMLENSNGHIFFTKPDLNLFNGDNSLNEQITNSVSFHDLIQSDPELFQCLQIDHGAGGPFIIPFCNHALNFTPKDEIIKTRESAETACDWKIMYGHRINDSKAADTVDITFYDSRFRYIYKLLKIWINYIHLISYGEISPTNYNRIERILDYAGSIYFFLTAEDGITIIYGCKLIGTFPLNIPSSAYSWDLGQFKQLEYSINFQYSMKDESPLIYKDFNNICSQHWGDQTYSSDPFSKNTGMGTSTWNGSVYIENSNGNHYLRYN